MQAKGTLDLSAAQGPAPDLARGSLRFIGTATVLLRYAGFTILTDPNFLHQGEQVHIGYGLRSTRRTNPAITLDELPHVDLVVLSHLHEDHFDRLVAQRLDRTIPIITTPQAADALAAKGFRARGLATWDTLTVAKGGAELRITSMPAKHAPEPVRRMLPPVMGSMLEFSRAGGPVSYRLYITGDTLLDKRLREIRRRYPEVDLMLLHLGGTRIFGMLLTMDARMGIQAMRLIAPAMTIPVHYNDYTVFKSPLEDFQEWVRAMHMEQQVTYLRHGETYTFQVAER